MAEYALDEICLRVGDLLSGLIYISNKFAALIPSYGQDFF